MFKSGNFLSCMDSFLPFSGTVHYIKEQDKETEL